MTVKRSVHEYMTVVFVHVFFVVTWLHRDQLKMRDALIQIVGQL